MPNQRVLRVLAVLCLAATMAQGGDLPRPAPDFTISFPNAKPLQISQYRGKVIAVAFIRTTCPHCQKTVGFLSTLQDEYGPRGFQVVACAIDDMAAMLVPDFVTRFHPPFPVGFAPRDPVLAFLQHPAMLKMYMPQIVFVDRDFRVRAQHAGDDPFFTNENQQEKNLRDQIEALLKADAPAAKKHTAAKKSS
jgi:peroxiredoxin